ncbi:AN1-type zinc finger protein 4-like [Anneissia japonica]|uniref:AN1-type zinc finger protein 4-like n=1 Tax=Anneissia japonica TaxID=1529436 RepID=UPI0014258235|nr:AN1-type zinc finger protein 4-like [Anneissia japonica]
MDYLDYSEYADLIELFVETLTGTVFELRVSPFETVISVKAKIQRLEGIPLSQQHLIWKSVELEDDYCLHDYGISAGCTLKLVLAMRGGPINTRRIPMEDPAIREMAEYMEANKDEILERIPGNRQVTLLVFREGDQLNFFRVVDRGDGTLTPLSESLSGASMYNMVDEDDQEPVLSQETVKENDVTMNKMKLLRAKMENMSISRKKPKTQPRPPSGGRPKSGFRRRQSASKKKKPNPGTKSSILPPLSLSQPISTQVATNNHTLTHNAQSIEGASHSRAEKRTKLQSPGLSAKALESLKDVCLQRSYTNLGTLPTSSKSVLEDMRPNTSMTSNVISTSNLDRKNSSIGSKRDLSTLKSADARMVTDLVNQANKEGKINNILCTTSRESHTGKGSGHGRGTSGTISLSRAMNSAGIGNARCSERIGTPETRKSLISAHSIRHRLSGSRDGRIVSPIHRLPPVSKPPLTSNKKKTSKRCFLCNKKTGLASSYKCRCGRNFCASHRYAEVHSCGYDYKSEGRKLLEQSNPMVTAPKLPKI